MKRFISLHIGLLLVVCSLLPSCAYAASTSAPSDIPDYSVIETVCSAGVRDFLPNQLSEVEDTSACIVEGKLLESKEHLTMDTYEGKEYIGGGYTASSMEILKVHSGDLKVGDKVHFVESYYISDASGTMQIVHQGNYLPAIQGERYLFFLGYTDDAEGRWYYPRGLEFGRYRVTDAQARQSVDLFAATNRRLELCDQADGGLYKQFYQEAIDKYMTD